MTAREKALAEAVERFLAVDGGTIAVVAGDDINAQDPELVASMDAMREALAMPAEPTDVTLFLVDDTPPPVVVEAIDLAARMFGATRVDRQDMPHGAWRFPDLPTARIAAVALVDLVTVARFTVPPLAVHYAGE
jgi:hypothetical protein